MNYRMILSLLGDVLLVIGAFLLLPCIVAVIYGEPSQRQEQTRQQQHDMRRSGASGHQRGAEAEHADAGQHGKQQQIQQSHHGVLPPGRRCALQLVKKGLSGFFAKLLSELQNQFLTV